MLERLAASQRVTLAAPTIEQATQGLTFTAFTPGLSAMAKDLNSGGHGLALAQQAVTIAAAGKTFDRLHAVSK